MEEGKTIYLLLFLLGSQNQLESHLEKALIFSSLISNHHLKVVSIENTLCLLV